MSNKDSFALYITAVFIVIISVGITSICIDQPSEVPKITYTTNVTSAQNKTQAEKADEYISEITIVTTLPEIQFPIEINSASKDELIKLTGVGEMIAQNIIDYRLAGNYFYSVEDIKNINGIGDYVYSKIKNNICVNIEQLPLQTASAISSVETICMIGVADSSGLIEKENLSIPKTTETNLKEEVTFPIELNSATFEEFMCLDDISEVIAARIITYRDENGGFSSIEEIMNVNGIGKAIFNNIKSKIYVDTTNLPQKETSILGNQNISIINLNTATAEELDAIPGITKSLAAKIIYLRNVTMGGKFSNTLELLYVDGIGFYTYNAIKDYVTV